jgi:alkanesulfonate monooxygenase SsuD/methylene tetrahydromethanopterin reductase-like flavin-dependent oxidoreductase (luciferase family)
MPLQQAFVNLRTGRPGKLPAPVEGYAQTIDAAAKSMLNAALNCAVVGSRATVAGGLEAFIRRTGADELIVTAQIHNHDQRKRSFEILSQARHELGVR